MRRELLISYSAHAVLILFFVLVSAFSRPMELPQRVYSVRIVAAPQPEVVRQPEQYPETPPEPEPAQQVI
ncbi:MAG TPA: hypothetical protein ENN07_03525, partial [candidate division Zixibacteria bacterium]|nr:hypothetical protein [candidate division Zixibacteria bacterium]